MRKTLFAGLCLSALTTTWTSAQTITKSTFTDGAGITLANEDGETFADQTYAELVTGGEPDAETLAVDLGSTNYETMLRFHNLFGAGPGQIPAGAHIVQATLGVRTVDSGDGSSLHRLLLPFEPATDTWNNWGSGANGRNGNAGVDVDDVEAVSQRDYLQGPTIEGVTKMDVTASVRAWQAAGDVAAANAANQGWLLDAFDTGGWDFTGFDATNPAESPTLQVTYTDVAPTTLTFQQNVDGYASMSDTYLSETSPNTTFGDDVDLIVGNVDEAGKRTIGLVKFEDIIGDQVGQLPTDSQLVRATLKLQLFQAGDGLELRRLGETWDEEAATWGNFAEAAGVTLTRDASSVGFIADQEGQFVEFDVTGSVMAWLHGAENNGWALNALPTSAAQTIFTAADFGADAPILELTFIPGAAPSVPEPSSAVLLTIVLGGAFVGSRRFRSKFAGRSIGALGVVLTSAVTAHAQIQTATFNTGAATMYSDGSPNSTYAQLVADGDPDPGDVSVDMGPLRESFLRFDGPIFGDGPGLVPMDAFIVGANLELQTTSRGGGAHMHRLLVPFDPATDTFNTWGSGLNGRNSTPGTQADGVEAVADIDVTTGFQEEGFSRINVTDSLLAWQELGTAEAANAANLGWYMQAINDEGWDFNTFEGATPPKLNVQFSTIPPTVLTFAEGVNGYAGTEDTYIAESDADASFGDEDGVSVGGLDDEGGERIGLLRFNDIIGDGEGQIPTDAVLVRAELKFNALDDGDGIEIRQMLTDWSEDATWNSLIDGAQMSLLTDDAVGEVEGVFSLDVTRSVQAWLNGDENLGWALTALLGSDSTSDLASSELTDSPLGDTNGDGEVNLDDLNNVRNNFGAAGPSIPGDTDGDEDVDLDDLNAVRNNFGTIGGGASSLRPVLEVTFLPGSGSPAAVPEPASCLLALVGLAAAAWTRRRV